MNPATTPKLGIAHFTVLEVPPAELVTLAVRIGYAFIGLRLHPAFPGAPFYEIPQGSAAMQAMRRRLDGEGVRVHDIEFFVLDAGFDPARLRPVLESAAELGASRLSVCGDDRDMARQIAGFAALCDLAGTFGIGVDLECMAWRQVNSIAKAAHVVASAGRPNGGVLVDALHLARTGGSPADLRDIPASHIRSAQLCDAPAQSPGTEAAIIQEARAERLLPGEGQLPLRALLAVLPDHVTLSVEVPQANGQPPEARARQIFDATQKLLRAYERQAR